MSKVKLDVAGWEAYTGLLGAVEFENGISKRELTQREMQQLGANLRIVKVDSHEQVGAAVAMVNVGHVSAELAPALQTAEKRQKEEVATDNRYTKQALYDLAEVQGIKGIRRVASEFGIKGVQISQMIDEILSAQEPKEETE